MRSGRPKMMDESILINVIRKYKNRIVSCDKQCTASNLKFIWSYFKSGGKKNPSVPDSYVSDSETSRQLQSRENYSIRKGRKNMIRRNSVAQATDKSRKPVRAVVNHLAEQTSSSMCQNLNGTGSRDTAIRSDFNSIGTENINNSSVRGMRQQRQLENYTVEHGEVRRLHREPFELKNSLKKFELKTHKSRIIQSAKIWSEITSKKSNNLNCGTSISGDSQRIVVRNNRNEDIEAGRQSRSIQHHKQPISCLITKQNSVTKNSMKDHIKGQTQSNKYPTTACKQQLGNFQKTGLNSFGTADEDKNLVVNRNNYKTAINTGAVKEILIASKKDMESSELITVSNKNAPCKKAPLIETRNVIELSGLSENRVFSRFQQYLETPQTTADPIIVHKKIGLSIENMTKIHKNIDEASGSIERGQGVRRVNRECRIPLFKQKGENIGKTNKILSRSNNSINDLKKQELINVSDDNSVSTQAAPNRQLNSNPSQQNNETLQMNADQIIFEENVILELEDRSIDQETDLIQCEDKDNNLRGGEPEETYEKKLKSLKYDDARNMTTAHYEHTSDISNQHTEGLPVSIDPKIYYSNEHHIKASANGSRRYENNGWCQNVDQHTNKNYPLDEFEQIKTYLNEDQNIVPDQSSYNLIYSRNDDEAILTINTPPQNTFHEHFPKDLEYGSVSDMNAQKLSNESPSIQSPIQNTSRSYRHAENSWEDSKLLVEKSPIPPPPPPPSSPKPCRGQCNIEQCTYGNLLNDRRTDIDFFNGGRSSHDHIDLEINLKSFNGTRSHEVLNPATNIMSEEHPESQSCDNEYVSLQNIPIWLNKNRSKDQIDKPSIRLREPSVENNGITNNTLAMRNANERNEESIFLSQLHDLFSNVLPYEQALISYISEPDDRKYHYIEENLMRIIFKLDKLKIDHSVKLRTERKQIIMYINGLLDVLDQIRKQNIIR